MNALKGDRLKVYKALGAPHNAGVRGMMNTSKWEYNSSRQLGTITSDKGNTATVDGACKTTYTFSGDKQSNVKKSGPGC